MNPLLSVVVPIYNVESCLVKCIESILRQTFQDFELLLIDDGSTDNSSNIAKGYAIKFENVTYIRQSNLGLGSARNTGLHSATGEYISFIDSDDYIDKNMFKEMLCYMEEKDLDVCICDYERVDEKGQVKERHFEKIDSSTIYTSNNNRELLLIDPAAWNKIYKRNLFILNDIEYPSKVWFEDLRTTMKILVHTQKVGYIDKPFYKYLIRYTSIMNTPNLERQYEIVDAMKDLISYFKTNDLFDFYYSELEFLCVQHVFIYGINRVIRINRRAEMISTFKKFVEINFPNFKKNKYLDLFTKKEKLFYLLIESNLYGLIALENSIVKGVRKWKKY